jgi:DNA-binding HxlR family transcriptional regulator
MRAPSDNCPLTPCIRLLSGAWTLEIIYHLRGGTLRFGELRRALGKVSSKVLTTRLRELEDKKVIARKVIPTNPPMVEYTLTGIGHDFLPILDAFSKVSGKLQTEHGLFAAAARD